MTQTLNEVIGTTFNISPDTINDETSYKDIKNWDSINTLFLIEAIEKEFGVMFSIGDIMLVTKVGDLRKLLHDRGINV